MTSSSTTSIIRSMCLTSSRSSSPATMATKGRFGRFKSTDALATSLWRFGPTTRSTVGMLSGERLSLGSRHASAVSQTKRSTRGTSAVPRLSLVSEGGSMRSGSSFSVPSHGSRSSSSSLSRTGSGSGKGTMGSASTWSSRITWPSREDSGTDRMASSLATEGQKVTSIRSTASSIGARLLIDRSQSSGTGCFSSPASGGGGVRRVVIMTVEGSSRRSFRTILATRKILSNRWFSGMPHSSPLKGSGIMSCPTSKSTSSSTRFPRASSSYRSEAMVLRSMPMLAVYALSASACTAPAVKE
mmetsp:Transcript_14955/g.35215  ORF Transcript_14955/g.35215 Transcript_14955/m.35215 type:complete len:300 (-) Transcript_14955:532-1431(-)